MIGPKTVDCLFIGYAHNRSAYRFLVHKSENSDIHKNTIMESRNASFFKNLFPYKEEYSSKKHTFETAGESSSTQVQNVDVEPKRGKMARTSKSFGPDFLTYLLERKPQSYNEAIRSPKGPLWKEAIKSEIDSILQNHTWELVDLPPGCKPLGYK